MLYFSFIYEIYYQVAFQTECQDSKFNLLINRYVAHFFKNYLEYKINILFFIIHFFYYFGYLHHPTFLNCLFMYLLKLILIVRFGLFSFNPHFNFTRY